jgi:putative transposase
MARPLRIQYPDAWYHVMNRGRRGEPVFTVDDDYVSFITTLRESRELWNVNVAAYCLMPNHYHLLVQTPEANLSRCMRHINGIYTQRFNKKHNEDGPLFKGRYKAILVDADSYLLELVRYIHRNPLRAGMTTTIDDYAWSSHRGYLSDASNYGWLFKDFVLSLFSHDKNESERDYRRFMSHDDQEELTKILAQKKIPPVLGSTNFIKWLKSEHDEKKINEEIPDTRMFSPEIDTIRKTICKSYGVAEDSLLRSKRGMTNEPRNVAIYMTRYLRGDRLVIIGREYGMAKYSSVSSAIERTKKQMAVDRGFKRRVEEIKSEISKSQKQT